MRHANGTLGWPEHAPYDVIIVTAGGPKVPRPLVDQLAMGGRLVMPVGSGLVGQRLVRLTRAGEARYGYERLQNVTFVPLIREEGWQSAKQQ